jgi:prepilin-type N-terminal cleavage/methylation domain-containing protein
MRNRGFSFVEVLFAVAILGIGFIMIAAIFPAAIMQTQAAHEESIGTAVTRTGVNQLKASRSMTQLKLAFTSELSPPPPAIPPRAQMFSFYDPRIKPGTAPNDANKVAPQVLWNSVRGDLISPADKRFAYIPLYARGTGDNLALVTVVAVRVRNADEFKDTDTIRSATNVCANLEPRPVKVTMVDGGPGVADRVTIQNADAGDLQALSQNSNAVESAAQGAYLIISNDNRADLPATQWENERGRLNGKAYRLAGELLPAPGAGVRQFELAAGADMNGPGENMTDATAFIVGRGYGTGTNYAGPSMAVQCFESFVALR